MVLAVLSCIPIAISLTFAGDLMQAPSCPKSNARRNVTLEEDRRCPDLSYFKSGIIRS
jgi:hypothetical protein